MSAESKSITMGIAKRGDNARAHCAAPAAGSATAAAATGSYATIR